MSPSTGQSKSGRLDELSPETVSSLSVSAAKSLRAVGFYAAIGLPFSYLPLLLGGVGPGDAPLVGALLVANALALVVGHGYGSE